MNKNPYVHLLQRKRTWSPTIVSAGKLLDDGEEVIQRTLALRCLEIPVGTFIADAMKGDLPDDPHCKPLLLSNVEDEIKHDQALDFAAQAHAVPTRFEEEAQVIKNTWLELDRHPVLKALVLERSVFFVLLPILRFLGDSGLRTVSADISRDEQTHVAANALVCDALKLQADPALDKLRKATMGWILQSLNAENENRYLSANFWQRCSNSLYHQGKAPELSDTRVSRQPAFFEISNVNLPSYS